MNRDFKKFFRLELKKGPIYDPKTHGEYVWNFGKLKGQSAYNTGYMNSNYIIWCYENIKDFDIPDKCKLNFMDALEDNICSYYNDDKNEKYLKYLKALVEYCKKYLYIITDYPCSNENNELVKKLVKDYISNN
jgi:hypothetical protein